ncbi:MAG TPA: sialate O-acetylesterase [Prevotellaceae bacterium]|nr:sialate O-acetylesterase [Prevotellaceae bacterium]
MRQSLYLLAALLLCTAAQAQRHIFLASSPATYPMENNRFYSEPDTTFYIFLAFGQSNMVGDATPEDCDYEGVSSRFQMMAAVSQTGHAGTNRGEAREQYQWYTAAPPLNSGYAGLSPCDYFGRTLVEGLPQRIRVGIINVAVGGCCIEHFFKEYDPAELTRTGWPAWFQNTMHAYADIPYIRLLDCALRAQHKGVIKGILIHQGESNKDDTQWPLKVKKVYDDLLSDLHLDAQQVPLLAGEVVHADQNGKSHEANQQIDRLPQFVPTAHVIPSSGCTANPADTNHFNAAGYRELGKRYGQVMLKLLGF